MAQTAGGRAGLTAAEGADLSWVAEILRKQHRVCARCRLGPTHLYDPAPVSLESGEQVETTASGTPLCNSCLEARLAHDFARFEGRCVLFEPALGPDAFAFQPLDGDEALSWPPAHRAAVSASLDRMAEQCSGCEGPGRFVWVPVEPDANLWGEDWLSGLERGTLSPEMTLCGRCAARRLMRTLDERGLFFEAIAPPRSGDGTLCCSESY